jgi:predicted RNase H-like HicB family nuclease
VVVRRATRSGSLARTYTARLSRESDGTWSVELDEEPRVHTWGRSVSESLQRMREATALWFECTEEEIELTPVADLRAEVMRAVSSARDARENARVAEERAADLTRRAANALVDSGLPLRDSAALLGISHQRVHQLVVAKEQS